MSLHREADPYLKNVSLETLNLLYSIFYVVLSDRLAGRAKAVIVTRENTRGLILANVLVASACNKHQGRRFAGFFFSFSFFISFSLSAAQLTSGPVAN